MTMTIIGTADWRHFRIVRYKAMVDGVWFYGVCVGRLFAAKYKEPDSTTDYNVSMTGRNSEGGIYAQKNFPALPSINVAQWYGVWSAPPYDVDGVWFGTGRGDFDRPTGQTLAEVLPLARHLLSVMAAPDVPPPSLFAEEPVKPPEPEYKGPLPKAINIHYDGQGWLVSAAKLIRPFRFAGHIAAEQYAAQIGERYNLPVKVV